MNDRTVCACGCGGSVADRRQGTRWVDETHRSAFRAGRSPAQAGTRYPGGMQLPFRRAVARLTWWLEASRGDSYEFASELAEEILVEALPDRQRERFEAAR